MNEQMRQGDLLIELVDSLPASAKQQNTKVVAYGEVTGHTHSIAGGSVLFADDDGTTFVRTEEKDTLVHDEHGSIPLDGNSIYRIGRQREYDAISEMRERQVAD